MTNLEKMYKHIAKAEEWQGNVLALEDEAFEAAKRKVTQTRSGHQPLVLASIDLDQNFWYRRAVANRNAHQAQANMYGLAAIVEEISLRPPVVDHE